MLGEHEGGRGADAQRSLTGFRRPWAFWLGVAAVTGGVGLHVPMFLSARHDHYLLAGMPWDGWMIAGMALMFAGYGSGAEVRRGRPLAAAGERDFGVIASRAKYFRSRLVLGGSYG